MAIIGYIIDAAAILGVMMTHWFSMCIIGLCSPEFLEVLKPSFHSTVVMLAGVMLIVGREFYPSFSYVDCRGLNVLLKAGSAVLKMNLFFTLIWVPLMDGLEDVMGVLDWLITELNSRIGGFYILTSLAAVLGTEENAEVAKGACAFLLLFLVMHDIQFVQNARRCYCAIKAKYNGEDNDE